MLPLCFGMDDSKYVGRSSSIRCLEIEPMKPVIGYRRQPKNSGPANVLSGCDRVANGLSRCDRVDGEERIETKVTESELGDKSMRFRVSIPIRKKSGENGVRDALAMEIIEEKKIRCSEGGKETKLNGLDEEKDTNEADKQIEHDEEMEKENKQIEHNETVEEEVKWIQIEHNDAVEQEVKQIGVMALEEEEKGVKANVEDELQEKTCSWNLRPRKPIRQLMNLNGSNLSYGGCTMAPEYRSPKKHVVEKKKEVVKEEETKKRCISIALKKEEIKEDLLLLGLKPWKKPVKRSRSVQNQVDCITPAKALDSTRITANLYRVSKRDLGLM